MLPITIALSEGKMWNMGLDTVVTTQGSRAWGVNNVYGMVYHLPDNQYYLRKLDAYYNCSLSALLRNHSRDINHRTKIKVIPLALETLEVLASHRYELNSEPVEVWTWNANKSLPSVQRRLRLATNRIHSGCNVEAIKEAFQFLK